MEKQLFRTRAFVSLLMLCSFAMLALSGFVLYAAPRGRPAGWGFLFLDKGEWVNLHIVFGVLFPVLTAVHLGFNWKPLVGCVRAKLAENPVRSVLGKMRLELLAAILLCVLLSLATLNLLPPASTLLEARTSLRASQEDGQGRGTGGGQYRGQPH
jgi:hypothetical protein